MTRDDLKKIQQIQTEIFFNIADICDKYEIEYVLLYGTLLGAVRHGGPIPWDDDIDIGMTRENYMRFLDIAEKLPEWDIRNEIHVMGSGNPEYMSELKIGRKGTLLALPGTEHLKVFNQIGVDVFLLDSMKVHKESSFRICDGLRHLLKFVKLNWDEKKLILYFIGRSNRKAKFFYKTCVYCAHVFRFLVGEENIEKWVYRMFVDRSNRSPYWGTLTATKTGMWPKDGFSPVELMYSGRAVSAAACYTDMLEREYGDYMKFPSEDKRFRKHFAEYVLSVSW